MNSTIAAMALFSKHNFFEVHPNTIRRKYSTLNSINEIQNISSGIMSVISDNNSSKGLCIEVESYDNDGQTTDKELIHHIVELYD